MTLMITLWWLFPASILIASIAMASGIGGAVFFSPIFMLVLHLEPRIAVGAALLTELFGFSSGLAAYFRSRLIDFKLALHLLMFSLPAAILGTLYGSAIPPLVLKTIFAVGLIFIGYQLFSSWRKEERLAFEEVRGMEFAEDYERELVDHEGNIYRYTVCNKGLGRVFAFVGGGFLGMISVGLAELQEYHLVARCKVPTAIAVATSVFVVVVTVLLASLGHFVGILREGPEVLGPVLNVALFTIPGVVIGGQVGPLVQRSLPEDRVKAAVSLLFLLVGGFMLLTLV